MIKNPSWRSQITVALLLLLIALGGVSSFAAPVRLSPAVAPADNPLKGLVPYAAAKSLSFPHSLEFAYIPLNELMTGPETFDWQPVEDLLNRVAARGNHAVFRIWMEWPGNKSGIPQFLLDAGVEMKCWQQDKSVTASQSDNRTPPYDDNRLVAALEKFIAAFGKRYDGDPRIGFITAGLLGTWGEWHTYPRNDLFASKNTQQRVLEAYAKAFTKTPILLRYPAGDNDPEYASNANRAMGYHEDSFAWDTLANYPNGQAENFSFMYRLKTAGEAAVNKWRAQPVGGEIRPELWGQIFDEKPQHPHAQDFAECVRQTHVTWLMDSGMFRENPPLDRCKRALEQVRGMGYDFYVRTAEISRNDSNVKIQLTVTNQGVAPFYYDWRMEIAAIADDGHIIHRWPVDWKLTELLPDQPPRIWTTIIDIRELTDQNISLAIRAVNPLPGGKPLRFANADQDRDAKGWLSIGRIPDYVAASSQSPKPTNDDRMKNLAASRE
jgi:hypothetical protein